MAVNLSLKSLRKVGKVGHATVVADPFYIPVAERQDADTVG